MAPGNPQPTTERAPQAPDLSFVEVDAIQQLRDQQNTALREAGTSALSVLSIDEAFEHGLETRDQAREQAISTFDDQLDAYLGQHIDKQAYPEVFEYLLDMLKTVSVNRMDSEKWNLGDPDAEGNHTRPETSGRAYIEATLAHLRNDETTPDDPPSPDLPDAPTHESIQNAEAALTTARNTLAVLSVQRRRLARNGSKKAKALEEQYNTAQAAYEQARVNLGALSAQAWRHEGVTPVQLRTNVINHVLDEHQNFTRAELANLNEDQGRKAKISRFLARHHALFFSGSALVGFGTGYGIGKLVKGTAMSVLGLGGAIALPAAIFGGIAIKTTKSVLQASVGNRVNQIRSHEKRANVDYEALDGDVNNDVDESHDHQEMFANAHKHLTNRIDGRVNKDIRSNRNRVLAAAAISGASGALGFLASSEMDHSWPFGHDHSGNGNGVVDHSGPAGNKAPRPGLGDFPGQHGATPGNHSGKGLVDGYNPNVTIEHGNGYQVELEQLAAQKDIHLTNTQSWNIYEHLEKKFHGDFLSNDPSYKGPDDWRISRPMINAHWNTAVIHEFNKELTDQNIKAN